MTPDEPKRDDPELEAREEPVVAKMGWPAPTAAVDEPEAESEPEPEMEAAAASAEDVPGLDLAPLEASFAALRDDLVQVFERKLEMDRFREEQVDRLHHELQAYRNDVLSRVTRPLFDSLIRLHDDLGRSRQDLAEKLATGAPAEKALEILAGFQEDVEIALERHGVTAFRVESERFDGRRQTAVELLDAPDASLAGRLIRRLRPGFSDGDTMLKKERVAAYRSASPPAGESPAGESSGGGEEPQPVTASPGEEG